MTPGEIVARLPQAIVAVIGDPMFDEYHFGRVDRICPEAPVPVFISEEADTRLGGAANVASQLSALGCLVATYFPGVPWTTKTRFMAGNHMLLRVDDDRRHSPTAVDIQDSAEQLLQMPAGGVVVLSDYAHGWLSPAMCGKVLAVAKGRGVKVIVDPKGPNDLQKFAGCDLLCPTESEFDDSPALNVTQFPNILLKRGAKGMLLHTPDEEAIDVPAIARKVFDVTGAGDTVVAVVAAARAVGATYLEAAQLAALAASYVVGEVGTTVCTLEKLKELIYARYPNP